MAQLASGRRARTDRPDTPSRRNVRLTAGLRTGLERNLHQLFWFHDRRHPGLDLTKTIAAIPGQRIAVVAGFERLIDNAIAAAAARTIRAAGSIRTVGILGSEVARFARFQNGIAAEVRRVGDLADTEAGSIDTGETIGALIIRRAAAAHAVHAASRVALEVVGAALARAKQTIIAAHIAIVAVAIVALFPRFETAIPAERRRDDAVSGRALVVRWALFVKRACTTTFITANAALTLSCGCTFGIGRAAAVVRTGIGIDLVAVIADFAAFADAIAADAHGRCTCRTADAANRADSAVRPDNGRNRAIDTRGKRPVLAADGSTIRNRHATIVAALLACTTVEIRGALRSAIVIRAAATTHALFTCATIEVIEACSCR